MGKKLQKGKKGERS
jgi:pescadillo